MNTRKCGAAVLMALLGLALPARAQEQPVKEPVKPAAVDALPLDGKATWDVKAFEDSKENYGVVKRTVTEKEIVWLLELKSDAAVSQAQSVFNSGDWQARFLDEDGVALTSVAVIPNTRDVKKGERVRFILKLPAEELLKKTVKVTIMK